MTEGNLTSVTSPGLRVRSDEDRRKAEVGSQLTAVALWALLETFGEGVGSEGTESS